MGNCWYINEPKADEENLSNPKKAPQDSLEPKIPIIPKKRTLIEELRQDSMPGDIESNNSRSKLHNRKGLERPEEEDRQSIQQEYDSGTSILKR